ncbi:Nickel transport system permease protein nikC [Metamycoplasma arthritidis]|uniref:Oligopeptide transport system permease protein n=1 Tax=Metamycoplasma arthritidis (strain 158L3-1) TaxID=243272 RepID=B3PN68_META1|nr:ABC transporter permease subunit [Metamycoplasma arthritidis]ACF07470.1 oligopeptide transport system permease protein [Metamycoplasma arthritidis 158L3-1]VEU78991.1 Nickel transport system permease protein nikC [Metamycoplasma arthritidis]
MEKINKNLLKFSKKKQAQISLSNQSTATQLYWKRFFSKKINIFSLVFLSLVLLILIGALFFIKYSPIDPINSSTNLLNNLPSEFSPYVSRNFERGSQLDFIRHIAELESRRASALGIEPVFRILYDSARDAGGDKTINTDIVTLVYSPYDLIKAINLNLTQSSNIKIPSTLILGTNGDGVDIYSRLVLSIFSTLAILIVAMMINIFVGFSLASIVALNTRKWYTRVIDSLATIINSIPELLWIFLLCVFIGTQWWGIFLAFALVSWTSFYEIAKSEIIELRQKEFILSAKATGYNQSQIIYRQLFKQILTTLLIMVADRLAINILSVSSLAFLDFVNETNNLNIGTIFREAMSLIQSNISYILILTLTITIFCISLKLFNNSLATTYNPKI